MPKFKEILGSGALGIGPKLAIENPEILRGLGLVPNLIADKLEDQEDKDKLALMGQQIPAGSIAASMPRPGMRKGGKVKKMSSGGKTSSASKRADGCATKGKTRGRIV